MFIPSVLVWVGCDKCNSIKKYYSHTVRGIQHVQLRLLVQNLIPVMSIEAVMMLVCITVLYKETGKFSHFMRKYHVSIQWLKCMFIVVMYNAIHIKKGLGLKNFLHHHKHSYYH